jgi:hypothetical protein
MGHKKESIPFNESKEVKQIENEYGIGSGKKIQDGFVLFGKGKGDDDGGTTISCVAACCCGGGGGGGTGSMEKIDEEIVL